MESQKLHGLEEGAYYAYYSIVNIYFVVTTIFYWTRRHSVIINKRAYQVALLSVTCNLAAFNFFSDLGGFHSAPGSCIPGSFLLHLVIPLNFFCEFIRIVYVVLSFFVNRFSVSTDSRGKNVLTGETSAVQRYLLRFSRYLIHSPSPTQKNTTASVSPTENGDNANLNSGIKIKSLFKMIGAFVVLEIIVWLFAFGLSKSNIPQNPSITWEKCEANADIMHGPIILLFIQALAVPWALMSLKNVGTAYLMKFEVSFGMLAGVFGFIFYSLLFVVMPNNDSVKLLHDFVPSITLITVHTVSIGIPSFLVLKHEYSLKTLMKWNEDDRVAFEKILSSPELFQEFKLQLARDFCIENGLFYDQYRKILPQLPPFDGKLDLTIIAGNKWDKATAMKSIENYSLEARQLILNLYRQFIATNAPHEVNIGATRKVAKKCMEQLGSLSPEIIHAIAKEVKENMLLNSYVKFKRTTQGV